MMGQEDVTRFPQSLSVGRKQILDPGEEAGRSWEDLQQRQVDLEVTGQQRVQGTASKRRVALSAPHISHTL